MMKKDATIGLYIVIFGFILYVAAFLYFGTLEKLTVSLNRTDTDDYTSAISGYSLPKASRILYSTMHWGRGSEPLSVCTVFSLPKDDLEKMKKYEFKKREFYRENAISPVDRGCAQFRADIGDESTNLFIEHQRQGDQLRGYTVYIDEQNKLVMLEMYLYD